MQSKANLYENQSQLLSLGFLSRFWLQVNKTNGCWLWTGCPTTDGYGQIRPPNTKGVIRAHRASWIIHNGPIPNGLWVLHDCPGGDNCLCVRPDHLWLGTHEDNMRDKAEKGRTGSAKLTPALVIELRNLHRSSEFTHKCLATRFNVSRKTVANILNGRNWKHVHPSPKQGVLRQGQLL